MREEVRIKCAAGGFLIFVEDLLIQKATRTTRNKRSVNFFEIESYIIFFSRRLLCCQNCQCVQKTIKIDFLYI